MKENQVILFGAGNNGILALEKYGKEHIAFFCDNSKEKQGMKIAGITVISFREMVNLYHKGYVVMITPADNAYMIGQLELEGIYNYLIFRDVDNADRRFPLKKLSQDEEMYSSENVIIDSLVTRAKEIDFLNDTSSVSRLSAEAIKISKEKKGLLGRYGIGGGESCYYGNMQTIMQYAGIPLENMRYFPIVSHMGCMRLYTPSFQYKSAVIMQGKYYRRKIHERAPYVPVFSIGPYIHYSRGLYSTEKLKIEKRKLGHTLLIFLPHSIENHERSYDKQVFINRVLEEYRDSFKSIWCCVYWADMNDSICDYAERMGIHIVSAGFRFDPEFNRRLKTILELADAIVVGDIGTFIMYALYMGKPIGRIDISDRRTITASEVRTELEWKLQMMDEQAFEDEFYDLFTKELKNTNEQKSWMDEISGFDQIRDAGYIKKIFEISTDIWNECEEDLYLYPEAVRKVYFSYEKHSELDKMSILKEAVGSYVD